MVSQRQADSNLNRGWHSSMTGAHAWPVVYESIFGVKKVSIKETSEI